MTSLNRKQQRFVDEYLIDLNATQAAIRAGYSAKTAEQIGYQLLQKTSVAQAVAKAKSARSDRTQVTADRVLEEIALIAFADPRKVMSWGPEGITLIASEDLDDAAAAIVSEVCESKEGLRVKLAPKLEALSKLGLHLGLFKHRHEHTGPGGGPIATEEQNPIEAARRIAFALTLGVRAHKQQETANAPK
jgi:phage terminase small subunit